MGTLFVLIFVIGFGVPTRSGKSLIGMEEPIDDVQELVKRTIFCLTKNTTKKGYAWLTNQQPRPTSLEQQPNGTRVFLCLKGPSVKAMLSYIGASKSGFAHVRA
jgi:hypothetical protein